MVEEEEKEEEEGEEEEEEGEEEEGEEIRLLLRLLHRSPAGLAGFGVPRV